MKLADELRSIQANAREEREKLQKFLKDLPDWFRSLAKSEKVPGAKGYLLIGNTRGEWADESVTKIEDWLRNEGLMSYVYEEGTESKPTFPMYVNW